MELGPTGKLVDRHRVERWGRAENLPAGWAAPSSPLEALMMAPPGSEPYWDERWDDDDGDPTEEQVEVARAFMAHLEPDEAQVLFCVYWLGMSLRDIADEHPHLGSKSSVQRTAAIARNKLRTVLAY